MWKKKQCNSSSSLDAALKKINKNLSLTYTLMSKPHISFSFNIWWSPTLAQLQWLHLYTRHFLKKTLFWFPFPEPANTPKQQTIFSDILTVSFH